MEKMLSIGVMSSLLAIGTLLLSLPVYASNTPAYVGFEATDNPPDTKDPNPDPSFYKSPDPDPDPNHKPGALRFTHLPDIEFGNENVLISGSQNYYPKFEERMAEVDGVKKIYKYPHTFVVEDLRGGAHGWAVNILADGKFIDESGRETFIADLFFTDARKESGVDMTDLKAPSIAGEINMSHLGQTPIVKVTTEQKTAVRLATARSGYGYSKWGICYGSTNITTTGMGVDGTDDEGPIDEKKAGRNPSVRLYVPNGQVLDTVVKYTTTLTWELTDTF